MKTAGCIVATLVALWFAPAALAADNVYWTNFGNGSISFANLDGTSGGGQFPTPGANTVGPIGLAIDPASSRIFWANAGISTISFEALDGSGGNDLDITGANPQIPAGVAIDPGGSKIYWSNS